MAAVQSPISLQQRNAEYIDDLQPLEFVGHWDKVGGCAEMINTGTSAMVSNKLRLEVCVCVY